MKGYLQKTNILLLLALWGYCGVLGQTIDATGGGIVKPDDKLSLSIKGDKEWQTCLWISDATKTQCTLTRDAMGNVTKGCTGALEPRTSLPSTVDKTVCELDINKAEAADGGTWSVTLDKSAPVTITITIAEKVKSVVAKAADLEEGKPGVLDCVVDGGNPTPHLAYKYKPQDHPGLKEVSGAVTTSVKDPLNALKKTYSLEVVADRSANGLMFNCQVHQFDKKNASLYTTDSDDTAIQVKYGPSLIHGTNFSTFECVYLGDDNIFHFAIEANPMPEVSLSITNPQKKGKLILNLGDVDGRYHLSNLTKASDGPYYTLSFTITKMIQGDVDKNYVLKVTNSVSEFSNPFKFKVGSQVWSTRTIVIIVVVALVAGLILLVACVLIIKKSKRRSNETTPLR